MIISLFLLLTIANLFLVTGDQCSNYFDLDRLFEPSSYGLIITNAGVCDSTPGPHVTFLRSMFSESITCVDLDDCKSKCNAEPNCNYLTYHANVKKSCFFNVDLAAFDLTLPSSLPAPNSNPTYSNGYAFSGHYCTPSMECTFNIGPDVDPAVAFPNGDVACTAGVCTVGTDVTVTAGTTGICPNSDNEFHLTADGNPITFSTVGSMSSSTKACFGFEQDAASSASTAGIDFQPTTFQFNCSSGIINWNPIGMSAPFTGALETLFSIEPTTLSCGSCVPGSFCSTAGCTQGCNDAGPECTCLTTYELAPDNRTCQCPAGSSEELPNGGCREDPCVTASCEQVCTFVPGAPVCSCLGPLSSKPSLAIPDNDPTGVTDTIELPFSFEITNVEVIVTDIQHTWFGDLKIDLEGPDGTTVNLIDRIGVGPSSTFGNSDDNMVNTVFDDAEANSIITSGTPPFGGRFRPEGSLSAFNGKDAQGTWKLHVSDNAGGDTGTIEDWGINFPCL